MIALVTILAMIHAEQHREDVEIAKIVYKEATEHYSRSEYLDAAMDFIEAAGDWGEPACLYNAGLAWQKLGCPAQAIEWFTLFAQKKEISRIQLDNARRKIAYLKPLTDYSLPCPLAWTHAIHDQRYSKPHSHYTNPSIYLIQRTLMRRANDYRRGH